MENYEEKATIFVIEQNAFVRRAICDWIKDMFIDRFYVIEVESCDQAYQKIPLRNVDLVLLDLNTLRKGNFELDKKMRKIYPGTKLILMSTEEPIYDPFKLLGENVTAFVNKFNLHDELYPLLEMHLSERKRKQS